MGQFTLGTHSVYGNRVLIFFPRSTGRLTDVDYVVLGEVQGQRKW